MWWAHLALGNGARAHFNAAFALAIVTLWFAFGASLHALWATNLRPGLHGFAAVSYTVVAWQGLHAVLLTMMGGYTLARMWARRLDAQRRNTFDNTRILWMYCAAQGLIALGVLHAPRLAG